MARDEEMWDQSAHKSATVQVHVCTDQSASISEKNHPRQRRKREKACKTCNELVCENPAAWQSPHSRLLRYFDVQALATLSRNTKAKNVHKQQGEKERRIVFTD